MSVAPPTGHPGRFPLAMRDSNEDLNAGLDRLQNVLLGLRDGDGLACAEAARNCGLSEQNCRTVLEGLTRAGLMSHEADGRFVRRTQTLQPS
jgi:DNA-binding IclR family transcriptional regulator